MTIADQLTSIANTKAAIKTAIEAKGVTVGAVAFDQYPSKIASITAGESIAAWSRPADWLAMPSFAAGEQKVAILMAIFDNETNAVAFYNSGAYTVDWGDGTTTNHSASSQAEKIYNYSAISTSTLSSRGYKQVLITITPQAGQNLTGLNLRQVHSTVKISTNPIPRNYLDVQISAPNCTALALGDNSSNYYAVPLCERVEIKEIGNITSTSAWCAYHYSLQSFIMPVKASVTNTSNMFQECRSLREVLNAVFTGATNTSATFKDCTNLAKITGNFSASTNIINMFQGCTALKEIDATFSSQIVNCGAAFQNCISLKAIPSLNLSNSCTSTANLFEGCRAITSAPDLNMFAVTNASNMFLNCSALEAAPTLTIGTALVSTDSIFQGCLSLKEIPLFNTANVTGLSNWIYGGIFKDCVNLQKVPAFDTGKTTTFAQVFNGCMALEEVPALNMALVSTTDSYSTYQAFENCKSLAKIGVYGALQSFSVANCALSASALTTLYQNLGGPVTSKTITVTNNFGAASVSKTSCGTTTYSTTVTQSNTTGLAVGQLVTGTGINTAVSVTTAGSTDRVNRYMHSLPNGKRVAFVTLTGTSGIAVKTIYYVVNADTDGFQLSLTPGGAVVDLVNDGSGTITYPTFITGITTNTSFTVDVPASSTGTNTLVARMDDTSWATLRGWAVA
ncbi:MAG: BspA family leucine-rich repeat surface protein [Zoogloea sp.]|uniref:BspA family leucine-rich repeat surface protein n=1 Tax=Zoogloea sp. TaxID=49181 RepID=UPI00262357CF|nr:BspA family leucine-rich repeat surface protein [Zoogloea sp.]MDD2988936.1 BspA family leucine-rich repeat surface protein [Zoogloea sp.]